MAKYIDAGLADPDDLDASEPIEFTPLRLAKSTNTAPTSDTELSSPSPDSADSPPTPSPPLPVHPDSAVDKVDHSAGPLKDRDPIRFYTLERDGKVVAYAHQDQFKPPVWDDTGNLSKSTVLQVTEVLWAQWHKIDSNGFAFMIDKHKYLLRTENTNAPAHPASENQLGPLRWKDKKSNPAGET